MARVLSGIQPTGDFHLGNYIGAVRHWVPDQDVNDSFFMIVDLHAISVTFPDDLARRTLELAAILLVAGIDPERSTLFVQSHVPEHAELTWVLDCLANMGELRRMTQFKEKAKGGQEGAAPVGLFVYPVLMAADILLYRTDRVPVGEDQRQHLELTRDLAERFNRRFGQTFTVPEAAIPTVGARVMDLQNPLAKMSKSAESPQGTIAMLDDPDAIRKKIRSAVTDSGRDVVASPDKPAISNLLTIFSVVSGRPVQELEQEYAGKGYAPFKQDLAEAVVSLTEPFQKRHGDVMSDPAEIERVLRLGADKARTFAAKTLADAYERVGFLPRA
jgi:tryptophanyl-tRNA synthetase